MLSRAHALLSAFAILIAVGADAKSTQLKKTWLDLKVSDGAALQAAPPSQAPATASAGVDASGNCTMEFILAYSTTAKQLTTVVAYVEAQEVPPNLIEAALACRNVQTRFPNTVCKVPQLGAEPKTSDFANACTGVNNLLNQSGGSIPGNGPVTDASPVAALDAAQIRVKIQNASMFQALIDQPRSRVMIRGRLYELADSLAVEAPIRCSADRPSQAMIAVSANQVMKGYFTLEEFNSGSRVARLFLDEGAMAIVCLNQSGKGLTLGDLKSAFGSVISISFGN